MPVFQERCSRRACLCDGMTPEMSNLRLPPAVSSERAIDPPSLSFSETSLANVGTTEVSQSSRFNRVLEIQLSSENPSIGYRYSPEPGVQARGTIAFTDTPGSRTLSIDHPGIGKIIRGEDNRFYIAVESGFNGTFEIEGQKIDPKSLTPRVAQPMVTPAPTTAPVGAPIPEAATEGGAAPVVEPTPAAVEPAAPTRPDVAATPPLPETGPQPAEAEYSPNPLEFPFQIDSGQAPEASMTEPAPEPRPADPGVLAGIAGAVGGLFNSQPTPAVETETGADSAVEAPPAPAMPEEPTVDSTPMTTESNLGVEAMQSYIAEELVNLGMTTDGVISEPMMQPTDDGEMSLAYQRFSIDLPSINPGETIPYELGVGYSPSSGALYWRGTGEASWARIRSDGARFAEGAGAGPIGIREGLNEFADRFSELSGLWSKPFDQLVFDSLDNSLSGSGFVPTGESSTTETFATANGEDTLRVMEYSTDLALPHGVERYSIKFGVSEQSGDVYWRAGNEGAWAGIEGARYGSGEWFGSSPDLRPILNQAADRLTRLVEGRRRYLP